MPNYKKIYFRLFGTFDIMVNKKSVLSKGFRQQGFNKLFVFFLLNHDRVFEIDTLIEKVWPDKEYHDNNSIMRTQIFRLKRQLAALAPSFEFKLEFTHGGYCFSYDPKNVVMDTDIFENLCNKIFTSRQAGAIAAEAESQAGGPPSASGDSGSEQSAASAPSYRAYAQGAASAGLISGPSIGAFAQARQDRMSGRGGSLYTGGIQYSDDEIMRLCSDALRIYQSGFLNEAAFDGSWLESYKQNYKRMWFKIIEIFTHLCYRRQNYSEIIAFCQEVMRFEDSEEYIHEIYMDALSKSGYRQDALRHYEIITSAPARKEAFAASAKLRDLQRSIMRETENNKLIDEEGLEQYIMELTGETGTVVCEKDVFLRHCSVLRLHSERSTYQPYICIIETVDVNADNYMFKKLQNISYLTNVVKTVFRKSDILCEWNDRQVLVLMACKQDFDADGLTQRIKLAIVRDNLTAEEAANENMDFSERMFYLPLSVKIMPIGESGELNEYRSETGGYDAAPAGGDRRS